MADSDNAAGNLLTPFFMLINTFSKCVRQKTGMGSIVSGQKPEALNSFLYSFEA